MIQSFVDEFIGGIIDEAILDHITDCYRSAPYHHGCSLFYR